MTKEYKKGDKVYIKKNLIIGRKYGGDYFLKPMSKFLEKEVTIKYAHENLYSIKEDGGEWQWTKRMFK